jgi:TolB-like protein/Flp pilus assembly protein TadD
MEKEKTSRLFRLMMLVSAFILFLGMSFYFYHLSGVNRHAHDDKSIAVLPFVNSTGDSANAYFCDGITEAVIADLNRVSDLRVSPRTSTVYAFKEHGRDIGLAGKELHAGSMLQGEVNQSGKEIIIQANLVDVASGKTVWSKKYDQDIKDLFSIQTEMARSVAEKLDARISDGEKNKLVTRPTQNVEAFNSYMQGRYYYGFRRDSSLRLAISYFNEAIKLDPDFSKAYSGLADSYSALGYISYELPSNAFLKAEAAAVKALELDSTLADPHNSLGYIRFYYYWEWDQAEQEFLKAQELNPRYALAYDAYAYLLTARERFPEAKMAIGRALELDPLSPQLNTDKGFTLFYMREYDQAIKVLKDALAIEPRNALAHAWLGRAYQEKKMYSEAIAEYEKTLTAIKDWPVMLAAIGHVYGITGRREEALKMLERMNAVAKSRYVTPYGVALVYASINDKEKAFEYLNKAFEEKSNWLVWLKQDPRWEPIKNDSRYQELVSRVGLLQKSPLDKAR